MKLAKKMLLSLLATACLILNFAESFAMKRSAQEELKDIDLRPLRHQKISQTKSGNKEKHSRIRPSRYKGKKHTYEEPFIDSGLRGSMPNFAAIKGDVRENIDSKNSKAVYLYECGFDNKENFEIEVLRKKFIDAIKSKDQNVLNFFNLRKVKLSNSRESVIVPLKCILFSDTLLFQYSYNGFIENLQENFCIKDVLETVYIADLFDVKNLLENILLVDINSEIAQYLGINITFLWEYARRLLLSENIENFYVACSFFNKNKEFCNEPVLEQVSDILKIYLFLKKNIENIDQDRVQDVPLISFVYKAIKNVVENGCSYREIFERMYGIGNKANSTSVVIADLD